MFRFYKAPITGQDLRRIRRATGFKQYEAAEIADCTVRWLSKLEHRSFVGTEAFVPKIEAWINAMRQRERDASKPPAPDPALLNQLRERRRQRRQPEPTEQELVTHRERNAMFEQESTLVELFISECCQRGDPDSISAYPIAFLEQRLDQFIDDEGMRRSVQQRERLYAELRGYLHQHFVVTKAGVRGIRTTFVQPEPASAHRPYPVREPEPVVAQQPAAPARPGLRGRWGEVASRQPDIMRINDPRLRGRR